MSETSQAWRDPLPPSEPTWGRTIPMQYRCPICEGRGIVQAGFYLVPASQEFYSSTAGPEQCRKCNGDGTLWTNAFESWSQP